MTMLQCCVGLHHSRSIYGFGSSLSFGNLMEQLCLIIHYLAFLCLAAVELPPWFSSMSFALESDVDLVSMLIELFEKCGI